MPSKRMLITCSSFLQPFSPYYYWHMAGVSDWPSSYALAQWWMQCNGMAWWYDRWHAHRMTWKVLHKTNEMLMSWPTCCTSGMENASQYFINSDYMLNKCELGIAIDRNGIQIPIYLISLVSRYLLILFLHENICCEYSLDASLWDASNEHHVKCLREKLRKLLPFLWDKKTASYL